MTEDVWNHVRGLFLRALPLLKTKHIEHQDLLTLASSLFTADTSRGYEADVTD